MPQAFASASSAKSALRRQRRAARRHDDGRAQDRRTGQGREGRMTDRGLADSARRDLPQPLVDRGGGGARLARRAPDRATSTPRCRRHCFRSASVRRSLHQRVRGSAAAARGSSPATSTRPLRECGASARRSARSKHASTISSRTWGCSSTLTHAHAHEDASGGVIDNESLEFLGDAVLGFVIADMLFHRYPTAQRGYKSKVKASIVSRRRSRGSPTTSIWALRPARARRRRRAAQQARDSRRRL